ncbi:hypothetical protein NDU88_005069 [Pleurodeles waltl]|uniref:Uncharacterized protein n=1 Tax=Pleurodeles waltl TaxID=8319 RepID=A0AAV7L2M8_PLEWA|nr:hypothetical protein NDU88_005069 [Pleurodeles waltl]
MNRRFRSLYISASISPPLTSLSHLSARLTCHLAPPPLISLLSPPTLCTPRLRLLCPLSQGVSERRVKPRTGSLLGSERRHTEDRGKEGTGETTLTAPGTKVEENNPQPRIQLQRGRPAPVPQPVTQEYLLNQALA